MSAEKILNQFFDKLKPDDFHSDVVLSSFYKTYTKTVPLLTFYIDYVLRNKSFTDDNERNVEASNMIKTLYEKIISSSDRKNDGKKTISKSTAMKILATYIEKSLVTEDVDESKEEQFFRDDVIADLVNELKPRQPKINELAVKRDALLNVWRDTEIKCKDIKENQKLSKLVKESYCIDINKKMAFVNCETNQLEEIDKKYRRKEVKENKVKESNNIQNVKLLNEKPLDMIQNKMLYICSGSSMMLGGNAEQGVITNESCLYLTTSYSIPLEMFLSKYPLEPFQCIFCPNVLQFKDTKYKLLNISEWKKVSVLMNPYIWHPQLIIGNKKTDIIQTPELIYEKKCQLEDKNKIESILCNVLETAYFLGFDSICLDDQGCENNLFPVHQMAEILFTVINKYKNKFSEIVICVENKTCYDIFKKYE